MLEPYLSELPKTEEELFEELERLFTVILMDWYGVAPKLICNGILHFPFGRVMKGSFALQKNSNITNLFNFL